MNKSLSRHKNLQFLRKISRKISIIIPQCEIGMKRFEKSWETKFHFSFCFILIWLVKFIDCLKIMKLESKMFLINYSNILWRCYSNQIDAFRMKFFVVISFFWKQFDNENLFTTVNLIISRILNFTIVL